MTHKKSRKYDGENNQRSLSSCYWPNSIMVIFHNLLNCNVEMACLCMQHQQECPTHTPFPNGPLYVVYVLEYETIERHRRADDDGFDGNKWRRSNCYEECLCPSFSNFFFPVLLFSIFSTTISLCPCIKIALLCFAAGFSSSTFLFDIFFSCINLWFPFRQTNCESTERMCIKDIFCVLFFV